MGLPDSLCLNFSIESGKLRMQFMDMDVLVN